MSSLTTSETARKLEVSSARVRQLVREGKLEATETPLGKLYDPKEVERLAKEREGGRQ